MLSKVHMDMILKRLNITQKINKWNLAYHMKKFKRQRQAVFLILPYKCLSVQLGTDVQESSLT